MSFKLDSELETKLRGSARCISKQAGALLFNQGDAVTGVYILSKGRARMTLHSPDGRIHLEEIVERGGLLGLPAAISGNPYSLSAEVLSDAERRARQRAELDWCMSHEAAGHGLAGKRRSRARGFTGVCVVAEERSRPNMDEYLMGIAIAVRNRANCVGNRVGAVVAKDARIISTGYNGTPRNMPNCLDGGCLRCANRESHPAGTGYDLCICVHAEQNAILGAARFGIAVEGGTLYTTMQPCCRPASSECFTCTNGSIPTPLIAPNMNGSKAAFCKECAASRWKTPTRSGPSPLVESKPRPASRLACAAALHQVCP